jgi:DNA-binding transcriptional LysR family regulator
MTANGRTSSTAKQAILSFSNLRIFAAVARHNNFSRAAEELAVSQPYISNQIAELEQKLDLILFRRVGRRVYLTDAGNRLYAHATSLLSQLTAAEDSMAELRSKVSGRLECATTSIPAQHVLPSFLEQLSETHPDLQVVLHISGSREVEAMVISGRIEVGITLSQTIPEELEGTEIGRDDLVVIVSPRHRLAQKSAATPQELSAEPLIVREPTSGTRVFVERLFSELRLPIRYGPELNNNEVIKSLVVAGVGTAILSTRVVGEDVRAGRLRVVKLEGKDLWRPIRVVVKRSQVLTNAADLFRTQLLAFCAGRSEAEPISLAAIAVAAKPR